MYGPLKGSLPYTQTPRNREGDGTFSPLVRNVSMRMRWVVEDYEALAGLIDGANRWRQDETAVAPGRLILRLRRGLQMSQLQLARCAGVPRSLVGRVESGGDVQVSSVRRLLAALGCGLVFLPASEALLAEFKAKAVEKRRRDLEWERAVSRLRFPG